MTAWTRRGREAEERLDEIQETLEKTDAIVIRQQPDVNRLVAWLTARTNQNGFGDDFEWTLVVPRRGENHG